MKNLFKIKSIVTLSLTFTFVWLSLNGVITDKDFMQVFLMVISFYFGTQRVDEDYRKDSEKHEEGY